MKWACGLLTPVLDYSGGMYFKISTEALFAIDQKYIKVNPIHIPLVLGVSVKKFSAKVLVKMKPFFASNRIWVGFYNDPPIQLELSIDPIISNKSIQLDLVNQIIEACIFLNAQNRILYVLKEFFLLPKMKDFPLWDSEGLGGFFEPEVMNQNFDLVEPAESGLGKKLLERIPEAAEADSFERMPSKPQKIDIEMKSLDELSEPRTPIAEMPESFKIKLTPPSLLTPIAETAIVASTVDYISSSQSAQVLYTKAKEYGIADRVKSVSSWIGVDSWISFENADESQELPSPISETSDSASSMEFNEPLEQAACADSYPESKECPLEDSTNLDLADSDSLSPSEVEQAKNPSTPFEQESTTTSIHLASQLENFEKVIHAPCTNLPSWAREFAVDLINHCADKAVEDSSVKERHRTDHTDVVKKYSGEMEVHGDNDDDFEELILKLQFVQRDEILKCSERNGLLANDFVGPYASEQDLAPVDASFAEQDEQDPMLVDNDQNGDGVIKLSEGESAALANFLSSLNPCESTDTLVNEEVKEEGNGPKLDTVEKEQVIYDKPGFFGGYFSIEGLFQRPKLRVVNVEGLD